MSTLTENMGLDPLPIDRLLMDQNAEAATLWQLLQGFQTCAFMTPSAHLDGDLPRNDAMQPTDATLVWLECMLLTYLHYGVEALRSMDESGGRSLQGMACCTWKMMTNRADQLMKGATPHFFLPSTIQFDKTGPQSPPENPKPTAISPAPLPGGQAGGYARSRFPQ